MLSSTMASLQRILPWSNLRPLFYRSPTTAAAVAFSSSVGDRIITGDLPRGGEGIRDGHTAEIVRTFTQSDVNIFAQVAGDDNPVHKSWPPPWPNVVRQHPLTCRRQEEEEESSHAVVHGMLVSSLFSSIFGTLIPGAVYRRQQLIFRRPVYVNQAVVGRIVVRSVRQLTLQQHEGLLVKCDTHVYLQGTEHVCVQGEADVLLPASGKEEEDDSPKGG